MSQKPIIDISERRKERIKADRPSSQVGTLVFVVGSLLALLVGAYVFLRPKPDVYVLKNYSLTKVSNGTLQETATATGKAVPEKPINLLAAGDGVLQTLEVNEGDEVKKGQVLGRVQSNTLKEQIANAIDGVKQLEGELLNSRISQQDELQAKQDELQQIKFKLRQAQATYSATLELLAIGSASQLEASNAKYELQAAQSNLKKATLAISSLRTKNQLTLEAQQRNIEKARSSLITIQNNAAKAVIRAPLDARVLKVAFSQGDTVKQQEVVFALADIKRMYINGAVDETLAEKLSVGQVASITINEQTYKGEVAQVAPQAVDSKIAIRVNFTGAVPKLRPNTTAMLDIVVNTQANTLVLKRAPFLSSGGERVVFVVNTDKTKATRKEIQFGLSGAESIEVLEGLQLGDTVISSDVSDFKDKETIDISPTGELKNQGDQP